MSDRVGQLQAQYGAGLASAINDLARAGVGYLQSTADIADVYDRRAMAAKGVEAETAFVNLQAKRAERFTAFARERSASPIGLTSTYDAELEGEEKEFLSGLDPRLQQEYAAKLAQDRTQRRTAMFRSELELMDANEKTTLTAGLNTMGTYLRSGQIDLDGASAQWDQLVEKSGLPPAVRQELALQGRQTLQGLQFQAETEAAAKGLGVTGRPADGTDIVAAGMSPMQRALLNTVGKAESPGYDVINGGGRFTSFADHPRQQGTGSSAAGRYQFTAGTWDAAKASYERTFGVRVPDFSPEWQDRVAMHWMERRYDELRKDGAPSFAQIMASGDPQMALEIKRVLGNPRGGNPNAVEWQGLGDSYLSDADFLAMMSGENGIAGGGTGAASGPDPWNDPRFADIDLSTKVQLGNASARAAEEAMKNAAVAAAAQQKQALEDAFNAGYDTGDLGALRAVLDRYGDSPEVEQRFRAGVDQYWAKRSSVSDVEQKLTDGTPLAARDQQGFAQWFGDEAMAGLSTGDADAYARLGYAAQQVRQFPEGAAKQIEAAITSPAARGPALDLLARIVATDPAILRRNGLSDTVIADAETYRRLADRATPEDALAQFNEIAEVRRTTNLTSSEVDKAAEAFFKDFDATSIWDSWMPGDQPSGPVDAATQTLLSRDARSAWMDGKRIYGADEQATIYMETYLRNTYGPTETGTARALMKYPPEKFYIKGQQNQDFLQQNVFNELARQAETYNLDLPPEGLYRPSVGVVDAAAEMVVGGLTPAPGNFFALVSDAQTERDVKAGGLPTYMLMAHDKDGAVVMLPGRFGGKELFDVGSAQVKAEGAAAVAEGQAETAAERARAAAAAKREQEILAPFFRGEKQ